MQQELAVAIGVVVRDVALVVDGDVRADEPDLAVADVGVGLLERRPPVAQGLHLGAGEDEPGLDPLEQVVVVPSPPVVHNQLFACFPGHANESRPGYSAA